MYAFALYDNDNLYLASDFFGEKSLYYYIKNNKLYFSSEIEPLIKLTNKELDEENFKIFLALGYLPDNETFYSQIKKLKPNTLMIVSRDLKIKFKKIYEIENYGDKKIIEQNDQKQFEELFIESVESRLTSDVELALMLSSGTDSSLIASVVSKELKKKLKL